MRILVCFVFVLVANFSFAQSTVWNLDRSHSSVNFEVDHMVVSETAGQFKEFSMNVKSDKADFTDAVFDITMKTASISTDDAKRDAHLKSEDFFDAAKYPLISFKGRKFNQVSGNRYTVTGDFTMHGVTKTLTLDAKFNGTVKDPYGNTRTGIKVTGEIDRYDFGLKYNSALEAGGLTVGQKVRINCNIELIKVK